MNPSESKVITGRVLSRDILMGENIGERAGGRGVLGVYYLLIHYYYCQSEVGKTAVKGGGDALAGVVLSGGFT